MTVKDKILTIGSDHAGFKLKEFLRKKLADESYELIDYGSYSEERADYPDFAISLCKDIVSGKYDRGILICGSGNGMAMTANKFKGIRAALCWTPELGRLARSHNDANVLALPGRFIGEEEAYNIAEVFLNTGFEGGRHIARLEKLNQIEGC